MVCIEIILTSLAQYEDDSLTRILSGHHHVLSNRGIPCSGNAVPGWECTIPGWECTIPRSVTVTMITWACEALVMVREKIICELASRGTR